MVVKVCKYNQTGFCKFNEHCRNRHEDEICGNSKCDNMECEKRHPRPCKYYLLYDFCKFGDNCAYLHKEREDKTVMKDLKNRLEVAEDRIKCLEKQILQLGVEKESHTEDDDKIEISQKSTVEASSNAIIVQSFKCELCDFMSNRKNGLIIHMSHRHRKIEQLDGVADDVPNSDDEDDVYESTKKFWQTGYLGTCFQTYLDALSIVKESDLEENEKNFEKTTILDARKEAFGDNYLYVPPWRKY